MSRGTLDPAVSAFLSLTGLSPSLAGLSRSVPLGSQITSAVRTPPCSHGGLGSSGSARRYSRNHWLSLRTAFVFFSSGYLDVSVHRVPPVCLLGAFAPCSAYGGGGFLRRVSPFRDPWINGHLHLPMAFRSLSRLSSALSAKASALRSFLLDLFPGCLAWHPLTVLLSLLFRKCLHFLPRMSHYLVLQT